MNDVQPFAFGRQTSQSSAMIGGLDKLGDRLARRLRALVEPYSGGRPLVSARPIDKMAYTMWEACAPRLVSLSFYRLMPIKGVATLRIDAALVSSLVDRFYGGRGPRGHAERQEFTPTETRLIARLSGQIVEAVTDCWAEIAALEPTLLGRETAAGHSEIIGGETEMVVQGFNIDLGEKEKHLVEIIYPQDGLAAIEPQGGQRSGADLVPVDPVWQARLGDRMSDVRLPARTVLARPSLKMSELLALKAGDVIPIHIGRHLPLLIGERVFAHGSIGEQDGRAAFMIEKLA